jgi:hypothetical protein
MSTQTQPVVEPTPTIKAIVIGKFPGAFGKFQDAAFVDLKACGMDERIAHKVAQDYGSDIGNAMRNGTDFGTKVSKAKKDGESRINLSGKGETQTSRTMSIIRVCQVIDGLYSKEGLLKSREVAFDSLNKSLREYLSECEDWTKAQTFAD